MPNRLLPLWAAFSFLTRLAPSRMFSPAEMAASMKWAPVVGFVLGVLALIPYALGLAAGYPSIQALLYLGVMVWATRALHWDGLGDCLDAWGSDARGERFQAILKDSRCGSFAVLSIVLVALLQFSCLSALFNRPDGLWAALLAPVWGRAALLVLPCFTAPNAVSSLGRVMAPGCSSRVAGCWIGGLFLLLCAVLQERAAMIALLLTAAGLAFFYRLARREGGFNGDFLGASCMVGESAVLLSLLL